MEISAAALLITAFLVYILLGVGFYEAVTGGFILIGRICARRLGLLLDPHISGQFAPFTFRIDARKARRVYLAGTFNEWLRAKSPTSRIIPDPGYQLRQAKDGIWEISLCNLMPGASYEYAFIVDYGMGYFQWTNDPKAIDFGPWGFSRIAISGANTDLTA